MVTGGDNKFKNSLEEILKHYDEYRDQANDIISLKKENRSPEQEQKREEYSQWAKENIVTKNNKSPLIDNIINVLKSKNFLKDTIYNISYHQGHWYKVPYFIFSDKGEYKGNRGKLNSKKGYFIGYYFSQKMNFIYLIFGFGSKIDGSNDDKENLRTISKNTRNIIYNNMYSNLMRESEINFSENFEDWFKSNFSTLSEEINLEYDKNKKGESKDEQGFESSTIFSIKYKKSKFINNELSDEKLFKDLKYFIDLYNYFDKILINKNFDKCLDLIKNYDKEPKNDENNKNHFSKFLSNENFYFKKEIIENLLLSLKTKSFVILTGNSGTGKTKLAQLFGQYNDFKNYGLFVDDEKSCYEVIPVGANWTENRNLLGYENIITNSYHSTPVLNLILKAQQDSKNPYFLILDEMNLSHVERYFSDFLSAMESGEAIPLYNKRIIKDQEGNEICNEEVYNIPSKIKIPENLFIIGTVNVDETTYMFSPKVLDRANVLEFETISIDKYLGNDPNENDGFSNEDRSYLENLLETKILEDFELNESDVRNMRKSDLKTILESISIDSDEDDLSGEIFNKLDKLHEILKPSGFDFGFRVINEILRYMVISWIYENCNNEYDWKKYFDAQIKQKILPKIHGSELEIGETLKELYDFCSNNNFDSSADKLSQMIKVLKKQRYVSFIN